MAVAAEERAAAALPAQQGTDQVRVKRETIQAVLDQCQRALKLLEEPCGIVVEDAVSDGMDGPPLSSSASDSEADELCKMVQCKVDSESFLEKLGTKHLSVSPRDFDDDTTTWDMISRADLWEIEQFGADNKEDQDEYVLVNQEDIVEGIACFMAAYLLSLKETKELTPNQLQEALCKTLSMKKKKSKLRKAWEGSQVIYNVASWGATAIGIYQNPAILKAASVTLWASCRVVSKLF